MKIYNEVKMLENNMEI